jgi:hypothetical protein
MGDEVYNVAPHVARAEWDDDGATGKNLARHAVRDLVIEGLADGSRRNVDDDLGVRVNPILRTKSTGRDVISTSIQKATDTDVRQPPALIACAC